MTDLIQLLLRQSPMIAFMAVVGYGMWSYIKEKNKIIREKDELLIEQMKELMELYGQAVISQNNLTRVIEELRKDFEKKGY